jgi:hypothetical protein
MIALRQLRSTVMELALSVACRVLIEEGLGPLTGVYTPLTRMQKTAHSSPTSSHDALPQISALCHPASSRPRAPLSAGCSKLAPALMPRGPSRFAVYCNRQKQRADERTRTADLLITSIPVSGCRMVQRVQSVHAVPINKAHKASRYSPGVIWFIRPLRLHICCTSRQRN